MLGEIQYGGRVTDDYDKRLLNTYCRKWFGENMFPPNFEFYHDYIIPRNTKLQDIIDYINGLPSTDTPEVFGLHGNADITYVLPLNLFFRLNVLKSCFCRPLSMR